jgi:hypothetical protein
MQHRLASCLVALGLLACNNAIVVELQTGEQSFDVAASSLDLPDELRDTSDPSRIGSAPCPTGVCPSTAEVPVECNASMVCDPAAISVSVPVGDVVDFDELLQSAGTLLRLVDGIEIESVTYAVDPNSLTMDLPATTVLWGPASASETSSGLQNVGTIPTLPAQMTSSGEMSIDADGSAALGDYIVHTARQVRFFARTTVDLNPGDAFPDGTAHIVVNIRVRAIGRIVN